MLQVLLTIQSNYTSLEPRCTHVFSSVARLVPLASLVGMSVGGVVISKRRHGGLSAQLSYGQIGAAILTVIVSINTPRRPDVYNNKGELIDQMRTVSIYSRYTFGWANRLLWKAMREGKLEETDLPKMDARRRAAILEEGFHKVKNLKDSSLLIHLAKTHARVITLQTSLTLAASVLTFSPQFFLYK